MISKTALEALRKNGLIIPFNDLMFIYHGRKGSGEEWEVEPNYTTKNNNNIYNIPMLSAADKETAYRFAEARKKIDGNLGNIEVHRIVPMERGKYIFDCTQDFSRLSTEEKKELESAFREMFTPESKTVSELAPTKFTNRDIYPVAEDFILRLFGKSIAEGKVISFEELEMNKGALEEAFSSFIKSKNVTYKFFIDRYRESFKESIVEIVGCYNAQIMLKANPIETIRNFSLGEPIKKTIGTIIDENGNEKEYPINSKYIEGVLSKNNIIGVKANVQSGTLVVAEGRLGTVGIQGYFFFDLHAINSKTGRENKIKELEQEYRGMSDVLKSSIYLNQHVSSLTMLDSIQAVQYMSNLGAEEYYLGSAGVGEGFSVGEHTETALRVFEESFEKEMPKELSSFTKYVILMHDIGKSKRGEFGGQKAANESICSQISKKLGIDAKSEELVLFVISESQEYTSGYYIYGKQDSLYQLEKRCKEVLADYIGRDPTKEEVRGLMKVCEILQTCDTAAYSLCSVTRDVKRNVCYYNGNEEFTQSLNYCGFGHPRISLKVSDSDKKANKR